MKSLIMQPDSVRDILDGRKTQDRRVVKPQPPGMGRPAWEANGVWSITDPDGSRSVHRSPLVVGDYVLVREKFAFHIMYDDMTSSDVGLELAKKISIMVWYDSENDPGRRGRWRSPLHMPWWASRLTLEIVEVRLQWLHDITEEDAIAEGIDDGVLAGVRDAIASAGLDPSIYRSEFIAIGGFLLLWNSINTKRGYEWDANPLVWAYTFEVVK